MTIATKRTLILPYTEQFESHFLMLNCCTKNRAYLGGPLTISDARDLFYTLLESADTFAMAVLDNYNREYVGHIQLSVQKGIGNLFFIFDKAYWGKGIAFEALNSFIPHMCERFLLTELKTVIQAKNTAAARLLRKLNFHLSGSKDLQEFVFICDAEEPRRISL